MIEGGERSVDFSCPVVRESPERKLRVFLSPLRSSQVDTPPMRVRSLRHIPALFFALTGVLLVLSLLGHGNLRDDRWGSVTLDGGRLKWCTRAGLIAGSALQPDEYLVHNDVYYLFTPEYGIEPAYGWLGLFTSFQTDGEDSECQASVLPLGLPLALSFVAMICAYGVPFALRRKVRLRRGLCPHCAYDLRATPLGSPCPECGTLSVR